MGVWGGGGCSMQGVEAGVWGYGGGRMGSRSGSVGCVGGSVGNGDVL